MPKKVGVTKATVKKTTAKKAVAKKVVAKKAVAKKTPSGGSSKFNVGDRVSFHGSPTTGAPKRVIRGVVTGHYASGQAKVIQSHTRRHTKVDPMRLTLTASADEAKSRRSEGSKAASVTRKIRRMSQGGPYGKKAGK